MKNKNILFGVILVLMLGSAVVLNNFRGERAVPTHIGKEKVKNGALLVDVRTPQEFAKGHVSGAINIPYDQVANRIAELGDNNSREVVFYCQSGGRSGLATSTLLKLGWKNAFNGGGIRGWKE